MAVLAIGLAVGELGAASGLVSFGTAFAIGGGIASALLAPHAQKPQFRAMQSAWGATLPIVYNSFRVPGHVIQAGPVSQNSKFKAKKSGPTFSQTFAVAFCEGPHKIGRIWADNLVIYDTRPIVSPPFWQANTLYAPGDIVNPTADLHKQFVATVVGQSGSSEPAWNTALDNSTRDNQQVWTTQPVPKARKVGQHHNFTIRIYPGDEAQLPDAALEELVGAGNQTGYRGLCYIVLENFDLSKFGNRIPNIEAEVIVDQTAITQVWRPLRTVPGPGYFPAPETIPDSDQCLADWTHGFLYQFVDFDGGRHRPGSLILKNSASDGTLLNYSTVPPSNMPISGNTDYYSGASCLDSAGNIYIETYNPAISGDNGRISKISPSTLTETAAMTPFAVSSGYDHYNAFAKLQSFTLNGTDYAFFAEFPGLSPGATVEIINLSTMASVCHTGYAPYDTNGVGGAGNGVGFGGICAGEKTSATVINLYMALDMGNDGGHIPPQHHGYELLRFSFDSVALTLVMTHIAHYDDTDFDATWTANGNDHNHFEGIIFDPADNGLILQVSDFKSPTPAVGSYIVKLSNSAKAIKWQVPLITIAYDDYAGLINQSDVSTGMLIWPAGSPSSGLSQYVVIKTSDGSFTLNTDASGRLIPDPTQGGLLWNSAQSKMIFWSSSANADAGIPWTDGWAMWAPELQPGMTLADICADVSNRVGLGGEYDYSGLETVIPTGAALLDRSAARQFLESMQPAYFFDLTDIGTEIVGTLRSNSSVLLTIPEDELAASADAQTIVDKISTTRQPDLEIPRDLSINYYDFLHDYEQNSSQNARQPITNYSTGRNSISVPVVMTPAEAADAAARNLYLLWTERDKYSIAVSLDKIQITPADVIGATRGSETRIMRVTRASLEPSTQIISIEGVSEDIASYSMAAPPQTAGISTGAYSPAVLNPIAQPVLAVMDTAQLRASDTNPGLYVAGGPSEFDGGFDFEQVQDSPDGSVWTTETTLGMAAVIGQAASPLPDWPRFTAWDRTNSLTVTLTAGVLANASEADMIANFTNAAWLSNGEIIQFRDATLVSGSTWTLSTLLRGRFGTEVFTGTHGADEQFVFLDPNTVQDVDYSPALIGATRHWQGINDSDDNPSSGPITITQTTRRLLPFAPYYIKGARDGSHNLTITGLRRMRFRGVPLWHPPESDLPVTIEIDVMNGLTVARTITSVVSGGGSSVTDASAFSVAYSAADQVTDFGSTQPSLTVKVYQRNALAGRGYPGSATI